MKKTLLLFILAMLVLPAFSQDEEQTKEETFKPKHQVGLFIGHEHVFSGRNDEGGREVVIVPFWGLDYNYLFSPKFSIGLHTDFIIETFKVEKDLENGHKETVERTRPVAPAIMGFYKAGKHWSFGLGMGGEFSKEEDYLLTRAAVEYSAEINKHWELAGSLQYDFRWQAYDTWTIGLGIIRSY